MGWPCEAPEHDTDHCEANEGGGSRVALVIASQAAVVLF
jgi:hypothetical protein